MLPKLSTYSSVATAVAVREDGLGDVEGDEPLGIDEAGRAPRAARHARGAPPPG